MQSFVCAKFLDKYLIASRFDKRGLVINADIFYQLFKLVKDNSYITSWVVELFEKIGIEVAQSQKLSDVLFIREPSAYNFGRASYEITQNCNYRCQHCYLGDKHGEKQLKLADKKKVIELVHSSGCLWLQLTGG
jgi:hypothetical protein